MKKEPDKKAADNTTPDDVAALREQKTKLELELHQREEQLLNILSYVQSKPKV
ncbi:MAG: hypothetical protein ACKVOR_12630 [Flavobacteriales bacterium]